jgi:enhancing lycopene biosynthesis protein 2
MNKRYFGVILTGCGFLDGTDVHEATLTLLALERCQIQPIFLSTSDTFSAKQHLNINNAQDVMSNTPRSRWEESARISRGPMHLIRSNLSDNQLLDGLIIPGGYGLKPMGEHASQWPTYQHTILSLMRYYYHAARPIGLACAACFWVPHITQKPTRMTIGAASDHQRMMETAGMTVVPCTASGAVVDYHQKIVTTPAYLQATSVQEVCDGMHQLVIAMQHLQSHLA